MAVSDDNESFDSDSDGDDDDDDSFCDASFAEPANLEYIQRDLGASCLWDDEDFFREVARETGGDRSDRIHSTMDTHDDDDIIDNIIINNNNNNLSAPGKKEYDYYYGGDEAGAGGGTDHTSPISTVSSQPAMGDDEDRDYHERQGGHGNHHYHDDSLSGGFDDDSSEDSFCDADDFERANKEYLKTDLGASVFWNSKDMIDMDVDNTCSGAGFGTIAEAEELNDH